MSMRRVTSVRVGRKLAQQLEHHRCGDDEHRHRQEPDGAGEHHHQRQEPDLPRVAVLLDVIGPVEADPDAVDAAHRRPDGDQHRDGEQPALRDRQHIMDLALDRLHHIGGRHRQQELDRALGEAASPNRAPSVVRKIRNGNVARRVR